MGKLDTMGQRIRSAIYGAGFTSTAEFAKAMGLKTRNTVGLWINGDEVPEKQLARIAELTGKSRAWLRYGLTDAPDVPIERYVTGFNDGKAMAIELLQQMEPVLDRVLEEPERVGRPDAKPPAERIGRAEEATRPAEGLAGKRKPKQA